MINTIIWDWNGTLLDDTDICIESMNFLLGKRNLPVLTKKQYQEIFTFPVRDYYITAGFNFHRESFDVVAIEFMDLYFARLNQAEIFHDAPQVLAAFQNMKIRQVVISAMEHTALVNSVKEKGLFNFFSSISGIQDHFAASKTENAKKIVNELNLDLSKTLWIGDTIHDYEVARDLGVQCMLVANGHQSPERLKSLECIVVESLSKVQGYMKPEKQMLVL